MMSLGLTYYVVLFVELCYPTYASFKALKSLESWDDTQWLTYWVVYAFMSTAESLGQVVLQWIPLYYEMKLCFVLWMIAPQTQGAKLLYERYIRPFLEKYGSKIDPVFNNFDKTLNSPYMGEFAKLVEKHGPKAAEAAIAYAAANAGKFQGAAAAAAASFSQPGAAPGKTQ